MSGLRWAKVLTTALVALAAAVSYPHAAGRLEGRWILTGQSHGSGPARALSPDGVPLMLEFVRSGAELTGRVRMGGPARPMLPWPSVPAGLSQATITKRQVDVDAARGVARAQYTLKPSPDASRRLEIVEEYSLSDDGRTLSGTATVTLIEDEGPAGSYVVRRSFERAP